MNFRSGRIILLWGALCVSSTLAGAAPLETALQRNNGGTELRVHSRVPLPVSSMAVEYTIFRSTDMNVWEPVGPPISGSPGLSDELLRVAVPGGGDRAFYKVLASPKPTSAKVSGDAIYGFGTEFSRAIQALGQIPLDQFSAMYPPPGDYLKDLTFVPTEAQYWTSLIAHPDFQLNADELAILQTNAFVVSQRLGNHSFGRAFYKVYSADLPVYLSCDAVLHAWHRSYVSMLEEVEEASLAPLLDHVLSGMSSSLSFVWQESGGPLRDGLLDADYFIAVARSLLAGAPDYGSLGQSARVSSTLEAINARQTQEFMLFGTIRTVDFSQFTVRGHYETSKTLSNYFQAMMWCGVTDFQFTGSTNDNSLRELAGTVALHFLLERSSQYSNWQTMDNAIRTFVGPPDSMTFAQLSGLLAAANIWQPSQVSTADALHRLHEKIMSGQIGVQNIQGGVFWSPLTGEQIKLPRSFAVMPRRFTLDGWATGQSVYDRIIWDEDGIPGAEDKVMRRVPSALDAAFAVLGNNATTPLITARIADTSGHPWRDGYPYQHNLAAVRQVVDAQQAAAWNISMYNEWLACLRELSTPTTAAQFPDAMRTPAWAMKTLNTQLGSWTQLRHDTVLYAKQPYTGNVLCSYPHGFIEPRVAFWERMRSMAINAKTLLANLPNTGVFVINVDSYHPVTNTLASINNYRQTFLDNFASRMATLRDISAKQLARQTLTSNEVYFIQSLIDTPTGYSQAPQFSGWYPGLFYMTVRAKLSGVYSASDMWDPVVTDVHTDPEDIMTGDPGSILHEGVGNPAMAIVSVNWAPGDACVYAGPVFTHYEFELGPTTRKTDSQWKLDLRAGKAPPIPDWTRSYQVPGNITYPYGF